MSILQTLWHYVITCDCSKIFYFRIKILKYQRFPKIDFFESAYQKFT
jgi:hypothetical protein